MNQVKHSLFEFQNYQEFMQDQLGGRSSRSGSKTLLAEKLQIKTSYLSRILKGDADLTLEQALEVSQFLSLNGIEQEYFLLLVNYSRAGTFELKTFYQNALDKVSKESKKIERRIYEPQALNKEDSLKYYSRWIYLAVHIAVSVPGLKDLRAIANKFKLSIEEAQEVLDFLVQTQIISYDLRKRQYSVGPTYTHVGRQSDLI